MQFYNSFVLLDFSHQSRAAAHFRKSPISSQGQNNRYMKQRRPKCYLMIADITRFSQNCFHFPNMYVVLVYIVHG